MAEENQNPAMEEILKKLKQNIINYTVMLEQKDKELQYFKRKIDVIRHSLMGLQDNARRLSEECRLLL